MLFLVKSGLKVWPRIGLEHSTDKVLEQIRMYLLSRNGTMNSNKGTNSTKSDSYDISAMQMPVMVHSFENINLSCAYNIQCMNFLVVLLMLTAWNISVANNCPWILLIFLIVGIVFFLDWPTLKFEITQKQFERSFDANNFKVWRTGVLDEIEILGRFPATKKNLFYKNHIRFLFCHNLYERPWLHESNWKYFGWRFRISFSIWNVWDY